MISYIIITGPGLDGCMGGGWDYGYLYDETLGYGRVMRGVGLFS